MPFGPLHLTPPSAPGVTSAPGMRGSLLLPLTSVSVCRARLLVSWIAAGLKCSARTPFGAHAALPERLRTTGARAGSLERIVSEFPLVHEAGPLGRRTAHG
ncbi:hypothetical protein GCM10010313_40560 [Streptomyces violarus]|nr:hypothetical protein GCM10010313_40560 [Streptomyces violarus]